MKNVQISQELFVALLHYHLSGENEYEENRAWSKNWMRCCGMSCMPSTRQHPPRNSGSRLGRSIWTDEACQKVFAGEFLYWQRTGACHAPVNAITQEGGVGQSSGEVQRNPVRRRRAHGRAQRHLLMDGTSVKSAFALLSMKVTKPMPCPAPVTSTEKGRAIEKNYFRNAGSRLPQP